MPGMNPQSAYSRTSEIEKFSAVSDQWWDIDGPFKPLHKLNPVRLDYIKRQVCTHFERDYNGLSSLKDLSILDAGCGGGLVAEPLAILGGDVMGIDGDENAIRVAKAHQSQTEDIKDQKLSLTYRHAFTQDIDKSFDVVLALEIIEHIDDQDAFVESCVRVLKPGGLVIFSTLNRTLKSRLLGVYAAERILRWLPVGTHDWNRFVKPSELARMARASDLQMLDVTGLTYNPLRDGFALNRDDLAINYFFTAVKQA